MLRVHKHAHKLSAVNFRCGEIRNVFVPSAKFQYNNKKKRAHTMRAFIKFHLIPPHWNKF